MPNLSTFTALQPYLIVERSEATPGLFNNLVSVLSQNLDQLNVDTFALSAAAPPGALNAASLPGSGISQIQAAINKASSLAIPIVFLPTNLLPFDGSQISFIYTVQMVREGGDWSVYDALAYGAFGDGVNDDVPGILSAISASPTSGGLVYVPKPKANWRFGQDLNIRRNNVTVQWAPATTLMNGNRLVVKSGSDNVSLIGTGGANLAFSGSPGGTYFDYQSAGTRTAFQIGASDAATRQFLIRDIGITVSGSSTNAIALGLVGVQNFEVERVATLGAINTNHIGMKFDGSAGPAPCFVGDVKFPYVVNAPTGILVQTANSVNIYGGEVSGSTTSGLGITFNLADGCWIFGTDVENWATAIDFNGATNCIAFPRIESAITEVQWRGGAGNCPVYVGRSLTSLSNAGVGGAIYSGSRQANGAVVTLTDAATIAVDASRGNAFEVTLGGNRTMGTPSNPFMGQRIVYGIFQDATGGRTLTFNPPYRAVYSDAGNVPNARTEIAFWYDGVNWMQDGFQVPWNTGTIAQFGYADGTALAPFYTYASETSLGWYRSATSTIATSYGTLDFTRALVSHATSQFTSGTAINPSMAFTSETSLGLYRSGVSSLALSYGTFLIPSGKLKIANAQTLAFGDSAGLDGFKIFVPGGNSHAVINQVNSNNLDIMTSNTSRLQIDSGGTFNFFGNALRGIGAGTAILPTLAYSSETSLGLYRSATSTMALSYGTLDLTGGGGVLSIASLKIKSGVNNSCGTATLGSNGSVNVANTYVAANDLIFLTDQTPGGTLGDLELGGIRAGSGFTIQSTSLTDTSVVGWLIVRPT